MKKRFLLAAVAMATAIGLPSFAGPDVDDHIDLLKTINAHGVEILINDTDACDGGFYGAYIARNLNRPSTFILCQENRYSNTDDIVGLTEEDADTIRHEAWHMVQDCVYGGMGDGYLEAIYNDVEEVITFAYENGMEEGQLINIVKAYAEDGDDVIIAEIEAFTVAHAFDPTAITNLMNKYCEPV